MQERSTVSSSLIDGNKKKSSFSLKKIFGGFLSDGDKDFSVGVDIGGYSAKIVALRKKEGRIFLDNYVIVQSKKEMIEAGKPGVINSFAGKIIKKAMEEAKIKADKVNISVPSFAALMSIIEVSSDDIRDEERIIQEEVTKYIPIKIEDVVYGWQTIELEKEKDKIQKSKQKPGLSLEDVDGKKEEELNINDDFGIGAERSILLVVIMKEISQEYGKVMFENEFVIDNLEVDTLSLTRALIGSEKGCFLLLDIGKRVTNLAVVLNGNIVLSRTIDIAGKKITDIISKSLGVDEQRADQIKIKEGVNAIKGNDLVLSAYRVIADEIKKTIKIFNEKFSDFEVEKIILSGGASKTAGIKEFFEKETEKKISIGDPFSVVEVPGDLENIASNIGSSLSVAIGLALAGFGGNEDENGS